MSLASKRRWLGQFTSGLATAILVFGAVPTVLICLVGVPLPPRLSRSALWSIHGLFDLLAVVAWLAWAVCSSQLIRSVIERVRHRDTDLRHGATFYERVAARMAGAILVVVTAGITTTTMTGATTPVGAQPRAQISASSSLISDGSPVSVAPQTALPTVPPPTSDASIDQPVPSPSMTALTYTVVAGDSLWTIADRLYGEGGEWEAIAHLNWGHIMIDGRRFLDPSVIYPGWILVVPDGANLPGVTDGPPAPTPAIAATASSPTPLSTAASRAAPKPSSRAERHEPADLPAIRSSSPRGASSASGPSRAIEDVPDQPSATELVSNRRADQHHTDLNHSFSATTHVSSRLPFPELASLGLGVLLVAALARRVRRARAHRGPLVTPPDGVVDVATKLARFEGAPVLDWFELANRHLTAALRQIGRIDDAPRIRLFRVGADGVDAILAVPTSWAPPGWQLIDQATTWHLTSRSDPVALAETAKGNPPWLPVALPIGDDDHHSWLVPLEPGSCLPVLGRSARLFVNAMEAAQGSWTWSERVAVTDDPMQAENETRLCTSALGATEGSLVLFVGEPNRLSPSARMDCAIVTLSGVVPTDLSIVVDGEYATVLPLGLTVRPNLLDQDGFDTLQLLVDPPLPPKDVGDPLTVSAEAAMPLTTHQPWDGALQASPFVGINDSHAARTWTRDDPSNSNRGVDLDHLGPGPIEVKLLTSVPRIDGLDQPIDPKRARRSIELIAYLALHQPDPVTSDRLRTRVLGTADADAAAKTLFNTATAARRAMGLDADGVAYLPPGSKSGFYTVSDEVTVDANRAWTLVQAARSSRDTDQKIALYRAALELIGSEPFSGVLSGYAWWQAEGHEARVTGVLVDAACALAPLAMATGLVDLARWALRQARLVDHYSEALSRAAMQVAAASGDIDLLRREWAECQRRVNELDPGSSPSERTEQLFAELTARETVPTALRSGR